MMSAPSYKNGVYPKNKSDVIELWKGLDSRDAVCFDVDSTVVAGEFIDELANFLHVGDKVLKVTVDAMGGKISFGDALRKRLEIMRPSLSDIEQFKQQRTIHLTDGIERLTSILSSLHVDMYLISGGFSCLVNNVAEALKIPEERVFANVLLFSDSGDYVGFDESQPTSSSGGKRLAIGKILESNSYRNVIMIGDGATDAEASPPATAFIGFGGNVIRNSIRDQCLYYALHFDELSDLLAPQNGLKTNSSSTRQAVNGTKDSV